VVGNGSTRAGLGQAAAWLARGRYGDALGQVLRVRRGRKDANALALAEAAALFGLRRHREVIRVTSRALQREPGASDLDARLRILRAQALWQLGEVTSSRRELRRLEGVPLLPITRGRLDECLAYVAWREGETTKARAGLDRARQAYCSARYRSGVARVLGTEAGLLRESGRFQQAFVLLERGACLFSCGRRLGELAENVVERGDLLTFLGSWREARHELERGVELFRSLDHPAEFLLAAARCAQLDLAEGHFRSARRALSRARERASSLEAPREGAELLLHESDVHLAAGEASSAERLAVEAVFAFCAVRDTVGESRARNRIALASLRAGRPGTAGREARLALRAAPATRPDLRSVSELLLGQALLAVSLPEARGAFRRAATLAEARPGLAAAARLGLALASGADVNDTAVRQCLQEVERFGDRRVLAQCLAALRGFKPEATLSEQAVPVAVVTNRSCDVAEAALCLAGSLPPARRFAAAMMAIRPSLPWRRCAVHAGETAGWSLLPGDADPGSLPIGDPAIWLSAEASGPRLVDLRLVQAPEEGVAPDALAATALMAPIDSGSTLYMELDHDVRVGDEEVGLMARLAALLGAHDCRPKAAVVAVREGGLIGRCPAMEKVLELIRGVAPSELAVHITGETGTGKERVAHAVHASSRRKDGPFVPVNAAALPDELFEAELFGHVRGAFTGAIAEREGLAAQADGGTLFIDEVTELSPRGQAKLLRFLQDREYRRLGDPTLRRADVRFVTASNQPLDRCVGEGRFRADLRFRLCGMVIELPPLRERGDDVVLLARHFLARWAAAEGRAVPRLASDLVRALGRYPWPGNVRELEDEMHRLVVLSSGPRPSLDDLTIAAAPAGADDQRLRDVLRQREREHIRRVLAAHDGNRTHAAEALGITRQALLSKITRMGVSA
jgi:transcriptional regulator with AAA-type ATPase domain/tetratricopeptide (TPR) repeat protein